MCRAPSKQYQAYTTADPAADNSVGDVEPRTNQVSASEAAAWVTGKPEYDRRWPQCWGRCRMGYCALKLHHPACCYVRTSQEDAYDREDDDNSKPDASPYAVTDGDKAKTDGEGYWRSRNFFCWR